MGRVVPAFLIGACVFFAYVIWAHSPGAGELAPAVGLRGPAAGGGQASRDQARVLSVPAAGVLPASATRSGPGEVAVKVQGLDLRYDPDAGLLTVLSDGRAVEIYRVRLLGQPPARGQYRLQHRQGDRGPWLEFAPGYAIVASIEDRPPAPEGHDWLGRLVVESGPALGRLVQQAGQAGLLQVTGAF